ncbi:hypothetical protein CPT_Silvanus_047 [Stenotrophomonas phage Silvanus]|nr:hypothetical protein CPT_Silvanus_047 [Stenotrophomonas phage Silvanus]
MCRILGMSVDLHRAVDARQLVCKLDVLSACSVCTYWR